MLILLQICICSIAALMILIVIMNVFLTTADQSAYQTEKSLFELDMNDPREAHLAMAMGCLELKAVLDAEKNVFDEPRALLDKKISQLHLTD